MLKKRIIAAAVATMLTTPAFAGSLGDWSVDGMALYEFWVDTQQNNGSSDYNEAVVFTLHEIGLGTVKSIGGGNRFVWHVKTRIRNGDRENGWGNHDAWVGFEGDSWGQIAFGRFLTKTYTVINWPYSCDATLCEANAETGANVRSVGGAIRYTLPDMGAFAGEITYSPGRANGDVRASFLELAGAISTKPVKIDFSWQQMTNVATGAASPFGVFDYASDGGNVAPEADNTSQGAYWVGARMPISGTELVLGYKVNYWQNDNGLAGLWWAWQNEVGGAQLATYESITQPMTFVQFKVPMGKNLFAIGATHFGESAIDVIGGGSDELGDSGVVYGVKFTRTFVPGVFGYVFARHYTKDDLRPISAAPWQYGWMDKTEWGWDSDSGVSRFGFGAQLLF